jgi:hypothetical protein
VVASKRATRLGIVACDTTAVAFVLRPFSIKTRSKYTIMATKNRTVAAPQRHATRGGVHHKPGGSPRPSPRRVPRTTAASSFSSTPRCCQRSWKVFFRYCCCTAGWYPALVAAFVTIGCVLSLYSSAGCNYIDLSIGFVPSNEAAIVVTNNNNSTSSDTLHLGFFFRHQHLQNHDIGSNNAANDDDAEQQPRPIERNTATEGNDNKNVNDNSNNTTTSSSYSRRRNHRYREMFHEGCVWYDAAFEESIIARDRTWRVGRIIALIAGAASLSALVTIWSILLLPTPLGCIWPTILLPATMLSFIAEGSKFLLFDAAVCRNAMWYPSGVDSLPEVADDCAIGSSAYFGIAATVLHFVSLLCVCLYAPEKRKLDPDFGMVHPFDCCDDDNEFLAENSTEPADFAADHMLDGPHTFYNSDPSPSSTRIEGMNASIGSLTPDTTPSEPGGYNTIPHIRRTPVSSSMVTSSSPYHHHHHHSPIKAPKLQQQHQHQQREEDQPQPPPSSLSSMPSVATTTEKQYVSDSRLAVISKMSFGTTPSPEDMIAQLCSELDQSLP